MTSLYPNPWILNSLSSSCIVTLFSFCWHLDLAWLSCGEIWKGGSLTSWQTLWPTELVPIHTGPSCLSSSCWKLEPCSRFLNLAWRCVWYCCQIKLARVNLFVNSSWWLRRRRGNLHPHFSQNPVYYPPSLSDLYSYYLLMILLVS